MSKHTEGPWKIVDHTNGRQSIVNSKGKDVCTKPNAHLIAAAPNLLEIAEAFEAYLRDRTVSERRWSANLRAVKDVIAKATIEKGEA